MNLWASIFLRLLPKLSCLPATMRGIVANCARDATSPELATKRFWHEENLPLHEIFHVLFGKVAHQPVNNLIFNPVPHKIPVCHRPRHHTRQPINASHRFRLTTNPFYAISRDRTTRQMAHNKHIGSTLNDFLESENIRQEVENLARAKLLSLESTDSKRRLHRPKSRH